MKTHLLQQAVRRLQLVRYFFIACIAALVSQAHSVLSDGAVTYASIEGMQVTNHVARLLSEGGTINLEGRKNRFIARWESSPKIWVKADANVEQEKLKLDVSVTTKFIQQSGGPRIEAARSIESSDILILQAKGAAELQSDADLLEGRVPGGPSNQSGFLAWFQESPCVVDVRADPGGRILRATILVKSALDDAVRQECVRRTIGAAMGFVGEPAQEVHLSMFSRDSKSSDFSLYDACAFRILYGTSLRAGMRYAEAFPKLFKLGQDCAADLFPAGSMHWSVLPSTLKP